MHNDFNSFKLIIQKRKNVGYRCQLVQNEVGQYLAYYGYISRPTRGGYPGRAVDSGLPALLGTARRARRHPFSTRP
jgi:hypothetical protein